MVGTWYRTHRGQPAFFPERAEIAQLVSEVNRIYPAANLTAADVLFSHAGLVPLTGTDSGRSLHRQLETEARVADFSHTGLDGLIAMWGVKYTTACSLGEKAAALAAAKLGKEASTAAPEPLLGTFRGKFPPEVVEKIGRDAVQRLAKTYGAAAERLLGTIAADPSLGRRVGAAEETVAAQIIHGAREEMALHLSDTVFRRTGLGAAGHPGGAALEDCASLMARELGWDRERTEREIAEVEERYRPYRVAAGEVQ